MWSKVVLVGFSFYTLQKKLASVVEKQFEMYVVCSTTSGKKGGGIVVALSEPHA